MARDEGGFVWSANPDQQRYQVGRDGNHLVTTFQCDDCVSINLLLRRPLPDSPSDSLTLCCIRRLNLDALWGKETSTVDSTAQAIRQTVRLLEPLGRQPQYPRLGPFPVEDTLGYGVAVAMLLKSLEPGRYDTHQQFATIRKLRAGYHNVFMSSVLGSSSLRAVGGDKAKHFMNTCPTYSGWFNYSLVFSLIAITGNAFSLWQMWEPIEHYWTVRNREQLLEGDRLSDRLRY